MGSLKKEEQIDYLHGILGAEQLDANKDHTPKLLAIIAYQLMELNQNFMAGAQAEVEESANG